MSTDKYDRQTRLWGEGQYLISTSAVLIAGVDCTSLEIAKNLILSGIGQVTLLDDRKVNEKDIKENFFLSKSDLGKTISSAALESVLELNPDSKGNKIDNVSIEEYFNNIENIDSKTLNTNSNKNNNNNNNNDNDINNKELLLITENLSNYDLIISSNNSNSINLKINKLCKKQNLRVVYVSNYGLINYIRLYENYHAGLQLRLTDNPVIDLRIPCMWDELVEYCESFDLDKQDEIKHANTPYVVLLYNGIKAYKKEYKTDNLPKSANEKKEFKEIIKKMSWKFNDENNYKEAYNVAYYASDSYKNVS